MGEIHFFFGRQLKKSKFCSFFTDKKKGQVGCDVVNSCDGDLSKKANWFSWTSHCHKQSVDIKKYFWSGWLTQRNVHLQNLMQSSFCNWQPCKLNWKKDCSLLPLK